MVFSAAFGPRGAPARVALACALRCLVACGIACGVASGASGCTSPGQEPGAGGGGGGTPKPIVDPSSFDCTAAAPPTRVNPVPVACATDVTCKTRLVIAHRAAGGQLGVIAPENSLAAIRAGVVMGVDFIETDPRPTADGVLVNMHDTTVDRTTDGSGEVAKMSLAQLQKLHLKSAQFPGDFSCQRVPTVKEVLAEARGKVHVLLDANKADDVQLFIDAVHETDTLDWAIFDTDSVAKIDAALLLEPKLFTMIRVADDKELADELAHFATHPPVIVEIHGGGDAKALTPKIHAAKSRASLDVFTTDLAEDLLSKSEGREDPTLYASVFATGIDLAQTDRPDLVLKFLGRWTLP